MVVVVELGGKGGEPAAVREAPGSHSKLQAEGTDKAAGHSSGQMKAVKLTGGAQASHPDGSLGLGGGGVGRWGACARACAGLHTCTCTRC